MQKKVFLTFFLLCLPVSLSLSHAKDLTIKDYTFTWRVAKVGSVDIDVEKEKGRLEVILRGSGGRLATLYLQPSQAKAIGEVLVKTEKYHSELEKTGAGKPEKKVPAGDYEITFNLPPSKPFEVIIKKPKLFTASIIVNKQQALEIGRYLKDAEKMADLVNSRVKP